MAGKKVRSSLLVRVGLVGTAAIAALVVGSPAWADSIISINPGNVPTTAAAYENHCDANQGGGPLVGKDIWVFVLPGQHSVTGDFVSVTATFGTNGSVTIKSAVDVHNFANGGPATAKAWIVTPAGWTLTSATAVITGTAERFNLTHTCAAVGTASPSPKHSTEGSPSPSSPGSTPSHGRSTSPPATNTPGGPGGGTPRGGAPTGGGGGQPAGSLLWGIVALAVAGGSGVVLLLIRRRSNNV